MSKGNKLCFWHRIDLKQQSARDVVPLIELVAMRRSIRIKAQGS